MHPGCERGFDSRLVAGKSYDLTTGSYLFTENFNRRKVHFNEETKETYCRDHECVLSGSDRYIQITDEHGRAFKFMDRPRKEHPDELPESILRGWLFRQTRRQHRRRELPRSRQHQSRRAQGVRDAGRL